MKLPSRSVFQKTIRLLGPNPTAYAFGALVKSVTSSTLSGTGSIPCFAAYSRPAASKSARRSGSVGVRYG